MASLFLLMRSSICSMCMPRVMLMPNKCFGLIYRFGFRLLRGRKVCVCGDFNVVRCREERRSVSSFGGGLDCSPFNHFIEDNALFDLPLCGRNFTWYKGDGKSMSRIDRFLLSEDRCLVWPNCI